MGARENNLQKLQNFTRENFTCVFSIPVKFEIYFLALSFSFNGPGET